MTAPVGYYEGIGGSMCAAIMGLDRNKTPYDAWLNFVDPSTRPNLDDNEPVLWGQLLEEPIGREAARRLGVSVIHQPELKRHPRLPFIQAHVDFLVVREGGDGSAPIAGMEVKNRGLQMMRQYGLDVESDDDTDRVMATEALQCHHYMTVTGLPKWHLAVLIGGQKLLPFTIQRDEAMCRAIEEKCEEFWGYVERQEPPPPINVDDCNKMWPGHRAGSCVEATDEIALLIEKRKALKADVKGCTDQLDFIDFRIKSFMRDAEELRVGGRKALTWKSQERKSYTVEASTIRVMR